jgi:hypothetical protein
LRSDKAFLRYEGKQVSKISGIVLVCKLADRFGILSGFRGGLMAPMTQLMIARAAGPWPLRASAHESVGTADFRRDSFGKLLMPKASATDESP